MNQSALAVCIIIVRNLKIGAIIVTGVLNETVFKGRSQHRDKAAEVSRNSAEIAEQFLEQRVALKFC
jgi:hypothetical protein